MPGGEEARAGSLESSRCCHRVFLGTRKTVRRGTSWGVVVRKARRGRGRDFIVSSFLCLSCRFMSSLSSFVSTCRLFVAEKGSRWQRPGEGVACLLGLAGVLFLVYAGSQEQFLVLFIYLFTPCMGIFRGSRHGVACRYRGLGAICRCGQTGPGPVPTRRERVFGEARH